MVSAKRGNPPLGLDQEGLRPKTHLSARLSVIGVPLYEYQLNLVKILPLSIVVTYLKTKHGHIHNSLKL